MDSIPKRAPEHMDIAGLLAELDEFAKVTGDERVVHLLQVLRKEIALTEYQRQNAPLGWAPYGQGPRDLNTVKE